MSIEHKTFGFEIKAASDDGSTGEGIASAFHNIDSYGDIIAPGFFADDTARFLAEGFVGGINHNWDDPIGKPTKAAETAVGWEVGWKISATGHGKDVMILLKDKVIKKLSIGFRRLGYEWLETADAVTAYWAKYGYAPSAQDIARAAQGDVRLLTKGQIYEFSPVTVPANDRADITSVKNGMVIETERDFERFLRDSGFSKAHAVAISAKGFKASRRDSGDEDEPNTGGESPFSTTTEALRLRSEFMRTTSRLRTEGLLK